MSAESRKRRCAIRRAARFLAVHRLRLVLEHVDLGERNDLLHLVPDITKTAEVYLRTGRWHYCVREERND